MKKISKKAENQYASLFVKVKEMYNNKQTGRFVELANRYISEDETISMVRDMLCINRDRQSTYEMYYKLNKDHMSYEQYKQNEIEQDACYTIKNYLEERLNTLTNKNWAF